MSEENKKNAVERLEALEEMQNNIIQSLQNLDLLVRDVNMLRDSAKLLNNKIEAVVSVANSKSALSADPITAAQIGNAMAANNVAELTSKVSEMVANGLLAATDSVTAETFVVVSETDANGKIIEQRAQFLVGSLRDENIKNKLIGLKVGESVQAADNASIKILEAYSIVIPKAPEAPAATESSAPASDAPAPVAEVSAPASDPAPSSAPEAPAASEAAPADAAPAAAETAAS